ncbi:STAS domain-containing protein [Neisseriaceae bacterium B1]
MQTRLENNTIHISGEVSVKTLTVALCRQFESQCRQPEINALDFSGTTRADSACLSLLLTAQRIRSGSLKVFALPNAVQDLAQLYDLNLEFRA